MSSLSPSTVADESKSKTRFEEYLLVEYQYLAQALFNTVSTISEFFKQYILIVSLPISVAVVFLKPAELKTSGILEYVKNHPSIPLILFVLVGAAGLGVLGYVVNLRLDALLYARSVNGIRKSFYKASGINIEEELRIRVLPTSITVPKYFEPRFFLFVVLTFAAFDTAYLYLGLYFYLEALSWPAFSVVLLWLATVCCFSIHALLYWGLSVYREQSYLRSRNIGTDIDGVLNEHRRHFCELLGSQTGKQLDPAEITHIPVHEIPGCSVTLDDEYAVFNWPSYWTDMPAINGAATVMATLRNKFHYKVWIFTNRPWPQSSNFPQKNREVYLDEWRKRYRWMWLAKRNGARDLTRQWLKNNSFAFDKLVIETENTDTRDPHGHTRNRFVISQEQNIRIFVEDDLNKALKLADICELVFLLDQPYNQVTELPKNVIRVNSWREVEQFLRRIS